MNWWQTPAPLIDEQLEELGVEYTVSGEEKSAREEIKDLRDRLAGAGVSLEMSQSDVQLARQYLAEIVREAKGILSVSEMSKLSGVSRDTIYKMLEEEEKQ